ncbi:uncharacterized protein LOC122497573 isoform X2 [Leptopilina heterotoma]|uniref:uncharacterized protein LOC122497573 isoform X2 n=1 Tax=Leptopilina heterotoma TaxID=63436 RepID=UPI001CA90D04|nr:uncharacterized protein LOC122497573 isoform X2 [Leptopilina heterotoma]
MSKFKNMELLPPPKSLMNHKDSEKVWEVINKRYPKVAPLLCEMEYVLYEAEDLVDQLQSSSNLEIVNSSMDESSNVNLDEEIESKVNENESLKSDFENQETNLSTNAQEIVLEKSTELIKVGENKNLTEILGDDGNETEESLYILKRVVETIKKSENSILLKNCDENLKINLEPNEIFQETVNVVETKTSETLSTDADSWSKVVGDSSESNESFQEESTDNSRNENCEKKSKEVDDLNDEQEDETLNKGN